MQKSTKDRLQLAAGFAAMLVSVAIFLAFAPPDPLTKVRKLEHFKFWVATPAGEAFEVDTLHRCGESNMRKAAIHATQNQTGRMDYRTAADTLEAVTQDWARIYDGRIAPEWRCEIKDISFTNITGKAYIVTEPE